MPGDSSTPRRGRRWVQLRRRSVIVEGFHLRFVVAQVAWLTLATGLLAIALVVRTASAVLMGSAETATASADQLLHMHDIVWPALAGFLLAATAVSVLTSHRVAGPLYRFRQVIGDVARGSLTQRVRLRRGDYLTAEAAALEEMIAALRTRTESAQLAVAKASARAATVRAASPPDAACLLALDEALHEASEALAWFQTVAPSRRMAAAVSASIGPSPPPAKQPPGGPALQLVRRDGAGFTILELLIVLALIGTLAAIGVPFYGRAIASARVTRAVSQIHSIARAAKMHELTHGCLPSTLDDMDSGHIVDPWGAAYQYGVVAFPGGGGGRDGNGRGGAADRCGACQGACLKVGDLRKDRRLVPINSDFDLYSMGPDRLSAGPLGARQSEDDVIRAGDGAYVGVARDY